MIHTDGKRTIANAGPLPGDKTASKRARPSAAELKVISLRGTAHDRPVTWSVCQ